MCQSELAACPRYGVAQRERRLAMVIKAKGKPPQQDFTVYHENLKAEAKAARERAKLVRILHSAGPVLENAPCSSA